MAQSTAGELPRSFTMSNGKVVPSVGFGTYGLTDAEKHPEVIYRAISESGYRFLDCASKYANEEFVGQAVTRAISEGVVSRDDLFIVSKIWPSEFHDPEAALRTSLAKLQADHVDCYLIHWPAGFFDENPANRVPIHVLWRQLEALVDQGLTRSIGVSNFNLQLTADLLCYARIKPVFNEIELNPTCTQPELLRFLKANDILAIAYTPVCRLGQVENEALWADERLQAICERHGKSKAQVMINWAVARGTIPIPRSGTPAHIAENIDIFGFALSAEEVSTIDGMDKELRLCDKRPFTGDFYFFA